MSSSLLSAYRDLPPLAFDLQADGKTLINPTEGATRSPAYELFPEPIVNGDTTNGFDFHIVSHLPSELFNREDSQTDLLPDMSAVLLFVLPSAVTMARPRERTPRLSGTAVGAHVRPVFFADALSFSCFCAASPEQREGRAICEGPT